MEEKSMLELADQLLELREEKEAVQAQLKQINQELEEVEAAMIKCMTQEECSGFKRGNRAFSLVVREYPGAVPECKEQLYAAMKEHGFEHLFTINTQTLSATVKELKANNEDVLPDWLEGLVGVYERTGISVRKA